MRSALRDTGGADQSLVTSAPVKSATAMATAKAVILKQVTHIQNTFVHVRVCDLYYMHSCGFIWPRYHTFFLFFFSTGMCDCQHNTAGMSCERCKDGFYGDATVGSASDCTRCPCPAGATCAIVPKTKEVVCTNCPLGTTGTKSASSTR